MARNQKKIAQEKKGGRPKGSKETFSIRLETETRARLERATQKTKHSLSAYVELAVLDRLKKDGV
jgi:predicted DNA-binding protein